MTRAPPWSPSHGPVAVGGLGGSGTRVVAMILRRAGLYLGADLNRALDNLWFALLFQRPGWYRRSTPGDRRALFGIYTKAMKGQLEGTPRTLLQLARPVLDISFRGLDHTGFGRGLWPWHRLRYLLRYGRSTPKAHRGWGWKEPNTHVYIPELADFFGPALRYVHVVRHGLDMAFTSNLAQLFNWGSLYGVEADPRGDPAALPRLQLGFWVRANRVAIERGRRLLGSRFHLLSFDDLCALPDREIRRLADWLGWKPTGPDLTGLTSLVAPSGTIGRFRERDIGDFSAADVAYVRELGFPVGR